MFRFTIRDVLWLTVVVALACAWWLDRSRIGHELTGCQWGFWRLAQYLREVRGERLVWDEKTIYIYPKGEPNATVELR